jgi:hypothetical protein
MDLTDQEQRQRDRVLIGQWTRLRNQWQQQLDEYDLSPYAGARRSTSREAFEEAIAHAETNIQRVESRLQARPHSRKRA